MIGFPPNRFAYAVCSGEKTGSDIIHDGRCYLTALIIHTDSINDATVVVYDNTAASGKIIRRFKVSGADDFGGNAIKFPILCENGIYVSLSGTGASYIVDLSPG